MTKKNPSELKLMRENAGLKRKLEKTQKELKVAMKYVNEIKARRWGQVVACREPQFSDGFDRM